MLFPVGWVGKPSLGGFEMLGLPTQPTSLHIFAVLI